MCPSLGGTESRERRGEVGGVDPARVDEAVERQTIGRACQRVVVRNGHDQLGVADRGGVKLYGVREVKRVRGSGHAVGEAEGESAGGYAFHDLRTAADGQGDRGTRMSTAHLAERGRERCRRQR